eukprot:8368732-Pyramimonas_sp.AAC.1
MLLDGPRRRKTAPRPGDGASPAGGGAHGLAHGAPCHGHPESGRRPRPEDLSTGRWPPRLPRDPTH